MTSVALQTELEAVNVLLSAIDEAPVSSLALAGLYPLQKAKDALSEASRAVQSMGWVFNTEDSYPITRDGSNQLTLPANMLRYEVDLSITDIDAVARGLRLYNRKDHTFTFSRDVTGKAVLLLPWDDLPQAARHYITIRAARILQGRSPVSEATYRYSADDEQAALLAMSEQESDTGNFNMLRDSWSVASILFNRDMQ